MKQLLKPAPGLVVRDPADGSILPPEGRAVTVDQYWRRRLADGDVVAVEAGAKKGGAK